MDNRSLYETADNGEDIYTLRDKIKRLNNYFKDLNKKSKLNIGNSLRNDNKLELLNKIKKVRKDLKGVDSSNFNISNQNNGLLNTNDIKTYSKNLIEQTCNNNTIINAEKNSFQKTVSNKFENEISFAENSHFHDSLSNFNKEIFTKTYINDNKKLEEPKSKKFERLIKDNTVVNSLYNTSKHNNLFDFKKKNEIFRIRNCSIDSKLSDNLENSLQKLEESPLKHIESNISMNTSQNFQINCHSNIKNETNKKKFIPNSPQKFLTKSKNFPKTILRQNTTKLAGLTKYFLKLIEENIKGNILEMKVNGKKRTKKSPIPDDNKIQSNAKYRNVLKSYENFVDDYNTAVYMFKKPESRENNPIIIRSRSEKSIQENLKSSKNKSVDECTSILEKNDISEEKKENFEESMLKNSQNLHKSHTTGMKMRNFNKNCQNLQRTNSENISFKSNNLKNIIKDPIKFEKCLDEYKNKDAYKESYTADDEIILISNIEKNS